MSDEFTVPLCNGHHDSLHHTGDERAWWARHGILDPLKFAARLWAASRQRSTGDELEALSLLEDREIDAITDRRREYGAGSTLTPCTARGHLAQRCDCRTPSTRANALLWT